jgi:hypothetical protein
MSDETELVDLGDGDSLTAEQLKELGISEEDMSELENGLDGVEITAEDVLTGIVLAAVREPASFNFAVLKQTLTEFQCDAMLEDAGAILKAETDNESSDESESAVSELINSIED